MEESEIIRAADLNMFSLWMEDANWTPGAEILQRTDTIYLTSPLRFPACSFAFNLSRTPLNNPGEFIDQAQEYFTDRRSAFSLLLRSHLDQGIIEECQKRNMYFVNATPGMILDQQVKSKQPPAGAQLRFVTNSQQIQDFTDVVAESYQDLDFPENVTRAMFSYPDRILAPHIIMAVVYLDSTPVCTAMAMLSHGIAGVYWVGTKREARGRGLAYYCTSEISNAAFERGARKVILQASKFGQPIYAKMGYREFTTYPWFICSSKG